MWKVVGKAVDAGIFASFDPVEVLYEFDGPRTYTHRDREGQLCLSHWCDADEVRNRFIVVPFSDELVRKLKTGELALRDAIDQTQVWIADIALTGNIQQVWSVERNSLPTDVLPSPGTKLWPSLERASKQFVSSSA